MKLHTTNSPSHNIFSLEATVTMHQPSHYDEEELYKIFAYDGETMTGA